jgi:hypothetical protein
VRRKLTFRKREKTGTNVKKRSFDKNILLLLIYQKLSAAPKRWVKL